MIPTSTDPSLQKYNSLPTTTTTIVSKIPYVRNTSPNPSNYSSLRDPSLKQLPTNTITTTSIQLEHIKNNFRSNTSYSTIYTSNLQIPTNQQLDTNIDTINKNLVYESKKKIRNIAISSKKKLI